MTNMKIILIFLTLFFTACLRYHQTSEGGIRVNHPKVFKYNKHRFTRLDKGLIDTNAVYFKDSSFGKYNTPQWDISFKQSARFFNSGQVLFFHGERSANIDQLNNQNLGEQGYYIVKGTQLKIDRFEYDNGGQTNLYFGRIQPNGDIIFYEETPKVNLLPSFKKLENQQGKIKYSIWRKRKVDGLKHYRPDW
jgi:hypothetical protein